MRLSDFLVEDGLVTDAQVRRLREKRMLGKTLAAAAAAAGMRADGSFDLLAAVSSVTRPVNSWATRRKPST